MAENVETRDRLSELPTDVLVKILSFLDMKDVVRTSVLSTMWRRLWTRVDSVAYSFCHNTVLLPEFINFVGQTFMQLLSPSLNKFCVRMTYHDEEYDVASLGQWFSGLDTWLRTVSLEKNVKSLEIKTIMGEYSFPPPMYQNPSLIELNVDLQKTKWSILEEGTVSWPSLRRLCLSNVSINNEELGKILSGSPNLETVVLVQVVNLSGLDIMSRSVRTLTISYRDPEFNNTELDEDEDEDEDEERFEINAPWIKQLKIEGYFHALCGLNVPSLGCAKLDYTPVGHSPDTWPGEAITLIEKVHHVSELTLGPVFVEVLSLVEVSSPPLINCKVLTIRSPIMEYELRGIKWLLDNSNSLETLTIEVQTGTEESATLESDEAEYLKSEKSFNLKNIKVVESVDYLPIDIKNLAVELVTFLLKNSKCLENLVIWSRHANSNFVCQFADKIERYLLNATMEFKWELRRMEYQYQFSFSTSS